MGIHVRRSELERLARALGVERMHGCTMAELWSSALKGATRHLADNCRHEFRDTKHCVICGLHLDELHRLDIVVGEEVNDHRGSPVRSLTSGAVVLERAHPPGCICVRCQDSRREPPKGEPGGC